METWKKWFIWIMLPPLPVAPEALEMMVKALSGACGNPSSHYSIRL